MAKRIPKWVAEFRTKVRKNFVKLMNHRDGHCDIKINIENAYGDVEITYAGRKMLLQFRNEGDVPSIDIFPCGSRFEDQTTIFAGNIYADDHLAKPVKTNNEGYVPAIRQLILCPGR